MTLANSTLDLAGAAVRTGITHLQFHTGDPGAAGTSNVAAGARVPVTWGAVDGDGDFSNSAAVNKTDGTPSGACTHVSYWTALTGGTFRGAKALTGDQTFNADGEYSIPVGGFVVNTVAG